MGRRFLLSAVLVVCNLVPIAGFAAGTDHQPGGKHFRGHVQKEGSLPRIARPALAPASPTASLSKGTQEVQLDPQAVKWDADVMPGPPDTSELDKLFPISATENRLLGSTSSSAPSAPAASAQQANAAIDYAAIEKAYQDAVPKPPEPAAAVASDCSSNAPPTLPAFLLIPASLAGRPLPGLIPVTAGQAVPGFLPDASGIGRPLPGNYVDYDNCACGTPIPTAQCMQSRQVGTGAPRMPGMIMSPPVYSRLAVPGVRQMPAAH